jgi:hypothetical protein
MQVPLSIFFFSNTHYIQHMTTEDDLLVLFLFFIFPNWAAYLGVGMGWGIDGVFYWILEGYG